MKKQKRINFNLRFTPNINSTNGMLLLYLRKYRKAASSTGDKILKAISAYWLPFATQWAGDDDVKPVALASIKELESQIQYIRESFDLPQQQLVNSTQETEQIPQQVREQEFDYFSEDSEFSTNF